ncbi:hypothetical protein M501DRAFT_166497 [Patellaria atrata CBS 101060]|uniref:Uncharacterized protein n=1 Tax=Patellaria atrata CBS 101060 TaxID=1346257 RepID=A0A9P4S7B3_9PEZI|nr:hypothetical protein M501DRAFT_166497 [Patellaria atrata CBS 101060]
MVLKLYIRLTNVIKMLEDVRRAATVQKSDHRKEIARFEAEKEGKNQTYNRNMEKSKTDHEQQMEELGMSKDRKLTELSAVRGTLLEELKMIYIQHKEEREVLIAEVEKTTLAYRRGVKETEREFAPLLLQQANLVSEIQAKFDVLVEKVAKLEEKGVESGLVAAAPRPPAEPIPEAGCQIKAPISRLLNLAQEAPSWPLPVAVELPEAEPEVVNEITSWRRIDPELETGFAPGAPEILPVAPLAIVPGTLVSAPPLPHGPKIIVEATSEQQPDSIPFGMARIPGLYEVLVHDTSASVAGVRQEQTNGDDGVGKGKFEDEKVEEKTEFEDEDEDDWEDVYD